MRPRPLAFLALAACSCVAALGSLAGAGEPRRTFDMSRAFDAGPASAPGPGPADIVIAPIPADPPPLVERGQWIFDLRWDRGDAWLLGVRKIELPAPQATPRVMGRFALELFEGPALIERVRFDFPLLGVPEPEGGAIGLIPKLRTRVGVVFPATARGTRLELWDRASGRRWSLPWPVDPAAMAQVSANASADAKSGASPSRPLPTSTASPAVASPAAPESHPASRPASPAPRREPARGGDAGPI